MTYMKKEYEIHEDELQMASEPVAIAMDLRNDISRAISAEELIKRLHKGLESLFVQDNTLTYNNTPNPCTLWCKDFLWFIQEQVKK